MGICVRQRYTILSNLTENKRRRAVLSEKQTFENIEAGAPQADAMDQQLDQLYGGSAREAGKKRRKQEVGSAAKPSRKKRGGFILSVVLGILLALIIVGVGYLIWIMNRPQDLFVETVANVTEAPAKGRVESAFDLSAFATTIPAVNDPVPSGENGAVPGVLQTDAQPTAEPTAVPEVRDNIVNIMLMGIDAFENDGTTSGTEPHTDVMMVVAVNFDKDTVDLITLPRDTFTTAPGLQGFYKLNGVFNAGGGMEDMESGFALTCRAAEIWLGGISIPYYYALDFMAVVDIVDAIGGIDYDVDQPFTAYKIVGNKMSTSGKYYDKGMQHLDGTAVLQYLRIRHEADGLDSSRTARQRRMMVAIFNKLKTEGKMSQIPGLINAATSGIYTNTTLSQTTALATYAMTKISADQIHTRALSGDIWYQHYFKYCFVDQQNRLNVIKEVYGIDAEPIGVNTPQFENWLYDIGFVTMKHIRQPEKVFKEIQNMKDQGQTFTEDQIALYAACYQAYIALDEAYTAASEQLQKAYVDTSLSEDEIKAMEKEIKAKLQALNKTVKSTTVALRDGCGIHLKLEWDVTARWFVDQDINEVIVAFG